VNSRLEALWRDVRHGARSLRRNPILFSVAVLSLGLGIGASSTLYTLVDTILIHDVTARDAQRLFSFDFLSYPDYRDVQASGVFEGLAAGNQCYPAPSWREGDRTRQVLADCLSANFFEVVGGRAALGRTFTADEAEAERGPTVVVVSHNFWQMRLGGDPNVVGRKLTFNNAPFTVIGVLPAGYRAIQGEGIDPDVYIPFNRALQPNLFDRYATQIQPIGRLAAGRTREQTQKELSRVLREVAQLSPDRKPQSPTAPVLTPVAGLPKWGQSPFDRSVLGFSVVLGAVTALVLLIACANVAGLLLARGVARRREIAIRLAIGADRVQLIRQLLIEAALVAGAGTAAGIGLTFWAARLLKTVAVPVQDVTVRFTFSPDWRFACAAAGLGAIATLVSGLIPAIASSRLDLLSSLRVSRSSMVPRLPLRTFLVIAQISVSVILLAGAFLFVRNVLTVLHYQPGFDSEHTVWFDLAMDGRRQLPAQVSMRDKLYRALESSPGVRSVSWTWYLPFQLVYSQPVVRRADTAGIQVIEQGIGPGYLKTMGIRLVAGREFEWNDLKSRDLQVPPPVLINEAFAHVFFEDRNPVGERLMRERPNRDGSQMIIVGVSASTSFRSPGEKPVPLLQSLSPITPSMLVRVAGSADRATADLSRVIERTAPGEGAGYFTVRERLDRATWPARAATVLLGVLAVMGLILALIGLCGMSMYNVTRRTPEIGIRMALGADRANILRLMLQEGLTVVAIGAGLGLLSALSLVRFLSGFLAADISPWDPAAYVGMLATLFVASAGSIWFPCWRAARIDPSISLRAE
jgi:predicted permease